MVNKSTPYQPVQTTPFTIKEKIMARLWRVVWLFLYRPTPWFMYKYRVFLLNLFGAKVHASVHPESSAFIEFPWNLEMGERSSLGERTWIYCLDKIQIGKNTCIGQGCQLISASHDCRDKNFKLIKSPITINDGCWLTSNVTVLMGVTIGDYAVISTSSIVAKSIEGNVIAFGQPAKAVSKRFEDLP